MSELSPFASIATAAILNAEKEVADGIEEIIAIFAEENGVPVYIPADMYMILAHKMVGIVLANLEAGLVIMRETN